MNRSVTSRDQQDMSIPRTASRKRSSPNNRKIDHAKLLAISALAMSISYYYAAAFQYMTPAIYRSTARCSRLPSRPSNVVTNVVTDPNQLVKTMIEDQSLKDRAALEDLYRLSLDENDGRQKVVTRPKRERIKLQAETPRMGTLRTVDVGGQIGNNNTALSLQEIQPRRQPAKTLAMIARDEELPLQVRSSVRQSPRQFNFLTRGGNKRNSRRKSLSSVSPIDRNPTLLRDRMEERMMAELNNGARLDSTTREDYGSKDDDVMQDGPGLAIDAEAVDADFDEIPRGEFIPAAGASSSGKSSTMPGFMKRSNSNLETAHRNGIRLAERRLDERLVETRERKERRKQFNGDLMYKKSASVPDSLVQFAEEIHSVERITSKEELRLGKMTQEAIKLQKVYDGLVEKLQREPTDDEWCAASGKINMEAIMQTMEEGMDAKNKLVMANLRMVQSVVNVYIRNGLQSQYNAGDFMQEGIMALIRAAEKFDPSRGFRFSTYALYWIRSAMKRDQLRQSRFIQVPQRLQEQYKRIVHIRKELTYAMDRPPTMVELSDAVGMSKDHVERCIKTVQQKTFSLDQAIISRKNAFQDQRNADNFYSIVESKTDGRTDAEILGYVNLREDLIRALRHHLPEREATLLLLRYDLIDVDEPRVKNKLRTIAEVSKKAGLNPDTVRRSLSRSLSHLQEVIGDEWREYERELP